MNRNFLLSITSLIKYRTSTNILTHVQSETHVCIRKAWNHCLKANLQNSHNIFMQSMSKIQHTKHSHWHSHKTTSFPQLFRNILTRRSFSSKNNFRWIFSWPNFSISFVFEHLRFSLIEKFFRIYRFKTSCLRIWASELKLLFCCQFGAQNIVRECVLKIWKTYTFKIKFLETQPCTKDIFGQIWYILVHQTKINKKSILFYIPS